jgi:hypothetical protein
MKLGHAKIDNAKVEQGAWVDNIPEMGDLRLKVRGIGNSDYRRLASQLVEATPRQFKKAGRIIDTAKLDEINVTCLVDTVLIDWDGLEGDDGKPLKFDKAAAKTILLNPDYRPFRDAVVWAATVASEEAMASTEEAAGN